jgi:hypothetical protein
VPPTEIPLGELPPTEVPPTDVPPTQALPTEAPGSQVPASSDAPGSDVPSSEDSGSEPTFVEDVAAAGDGNATQPNTDTVLRRALSSGPNQSFWLIVGILGLLVGAIVMVSPQRSVRPS